MITADILGERARITPDSVVLLYAFLVRRPGSQITADELVAFLGNRLSKIKLPKRFIFVEALPRNVYGKVLKNELRATLAATPVERNTR